MSELGQKIIAEVRKVAAENPKHIYSSKVKSAKASCVYIDNGAPSCIVGHALWNLGLIDADWRGDELGISSINNVIRHEGWHIDNNEIGWLVIVQDAQDKGVSWGTSVEFADKGKLYEDV